MIELTAQDRCRAYTAEQLYAIEQSWFTAGNTSFGLMQQAAWQMASWLLTAYPDADTIGICAGGGNNGGDGWLIGCYGQQAGREVIVIPAADSATPDSQRARAQAVAAGVSVVERSNGGLPMADIYVDALLGIGLDRQPDGAYAQLIAALNAQPAPVIAVDVPSGLVADSGVMINEVAVRAEVTLCLIALKVGLVMSAGKDVSGEVIVLPLIPLPEDIRSTAYWQQALPMLHPREHYSHKGSYGHAAIIGGNTGMGGACVLAAEAALRIGAGKVTAITSVDARASLLRRCPDVMTADLTGLMDVDLARTYLSGMSAVAVGMGLGRDEAGERVMANVLRACADASIPLVIDADGLYHLPALLSDLAAFTSVSLIWCTPHPGEAARLLDISVAEIERDRLAAIRALQQTYGGVWLLKGAGSLVIDESQQITVCGRGNPGMATAGAGDVLSGMAAGWLAQGNTAQLIDVVMLHAAAGDLTVTQYGESSLTASDLIGVLPMLLASAV